MPRSTKRRGSRPIVVGQHQLRWKIGSQPSETVPIRMFMQIIVFSNQGGSPRLLVDWGTKETHLPVKDSRIKPRMVEAIIRRALAAGWDPESRGPDFRLVGFAEEVERYW